MEELGDLDALVKRCSGLPLMLRSVGCLCKRDTASSVMRKLDSLRDMTMKRVKRCLSKMEGYDDDMNLFVALEAQLDDLAKGDWPELERYCTKTAVFREDDEVPTSVLPALWDVSQDDANLIVDELEKEHLIVHGEDGISLLDAHRDYYACRGKNELGRWHADLLRNCGEDTLPTKEGYWQADRVTHHYCRADFGPDDDLGALTNSLVSLAIRDAVKMPKTLGQLVALERLDLSGKLVAPSCFYGCSQLAELPGSIGQLVALRELDLSGCSQLAELPGSIGQLVALKKLDLRGCSQLAELPGSIGQLVALEQLDLSGCSQLAELPGSIGQLVALKKLDLRGCSQLAELPGSIGQLVALEQLDLHGCSQLAELPGSIGQLVALIRLELVGCLQLASLPAEIGQCLALTSLNLGCLQRTSLPAEIAHCVALKYLKLSCSQLPAEIGQCLALTHLALSGLLAAACRDWALRGAHVSRPPLLAAGRSCRARSASWWRLGSSTSPTARSWRSCRARSASWWRLGSSTSPAARSWRSCRARSASWWRSSSSTFAAARSWRSCRTRSASW